MSYYNIGKIVNTQGIRGEVRVISTTDFPEHRFFIGNQVTAFLNNGQQVELTIDKVRTQKNFVILHFKGLDSINDIEFLKPSTLKITDAQLSEDDLAEGEYYYHQILGLAVYDLAGNYLGPITDIMDTAANDVWIVTRENGKELLLPKIKDVIKKVDLANQRVTIDLLEGLE
ncbi:ribosome maturation factor RimM [Nicoliella spurrieriana]|uniref:Ribosome maturation factor RimM n=1 Tax=Nicoliella spurrieriana TaxID=2925830 RepID=A0A976RTA5_9LACO|nr:ribosome maturation factor RimM [Nicoliella spurrieriana]UQS87515.1 ribosome maturation factor RimM [Nicoliella spurrieriana]